MDNNLFALLAIIFGLLNFALLKPLFDVIFEQVDPAELQRQATQPECPFTIGYFTDLISYLLYAGSDAYGEFGMLVYVHEKFDMETNEYSKMAKLSR
ncbi:hypothetical protein FKX85_08420 [Echinicola soli]|uniref:Uncharacterized protein n=1 Tax=Echinicola soli TaxID=2591634 RepID=A0A514CGW6_9BACT|nr:hypothetical protein [Echinicola soli]QDH79061.1 hypothetical protein FKX85_08420 [Echinicola soli]